MKRATRRARQKTVRYFKNRAVRANPAEFERILAKAGTMAPQEGDEIPADWLKGTAEGLGEPK